MPQKQQENIFRKLIKPGYAAFSLIKSMTNILVTGGAGQLGRAFTAHALKLQKQGLFFVVLDRHQLDITHQDSVRKAFHNYRPDVVINAAAYTNVEQAETEPEKAFAINATATALLAEECSLQGIALIHLSTDYVFDGQKGAPYAVEDEPKPINVYGQSKLAGEKALRQANPDVIIVRTSWLYSEFGENFQSKILRAAKEKLAQGEALTLVNDEWGSPTYAPDLVEFLCALSAQVESCRGCVLHFSGEQVMSRLELAEMLLAQAVERGELKQLPLLKAVSHHSYPSLAQRPRNSALKISE